MGTFIVLLIALYALFMYVAIDMIKYAPGQKRELDRERRARVHTKSHHYKIGSRR